MIKKNKTKLILTSVIILLPILAGLMLWSSLPDKVPTHWNAAGEIDGWSSKAFAVFGLPAIMLGVHILCTVITSLDPKNQNISGRMLDIVFWICPVMSVFLSCCTYAAALGKDVNIDTLTPAFIGVVLIALGIYLPKCQPNYTIGIKLPWTLHDENNWKATHRFAGPVWVIGGILSTAAALFNLKIVFFVILLLVVLIPTIYSYLFYRKNS